MNHEKSHSEDGASSYSKKKKIVRVRDRIEFNEPIVFSGDRDDKIDRHQVVLLRQIFWFWLQQSPWYDFGRGLFWGAIVGLTAIVSAGYGAALTKFEVVEQAIVRTIDRSYSGSSSDASPVLNRSLNVLVMEVKPSANEMIEFSSASVGESKTILLLKFQPALDLVRIIYIPTDSRVKIPEFGWGTIADANRYGGIELVSKLVSGLSGGTKIDRYIRATPKTFDKLIASGKITLDKCDVRFEDCSNKLQQISRQKAAVQTIRQRLNIPTYLSDFEASLRNAGSNLDTNLSVSGFMAIANFVKEVDPQNITVELSSKYVPAYSLSQSDRLNRNTPIAVQNTTNTPRLGMNLVSYLRSQNFRDVYLVQQIPLRLDRTRIALDRGQLKEAKQLKEILGFGDLKSNPDTTAQPITIQVGKDAHHLLDNYIHQ